MERRTGPSQWLRQSASEYQVLGVESSCLRAMLGTSQKYLVLLSETQAAGLQDSLILEKVSHVVRQEPLEIPAGNRGPDPNLILAVTL